MHIFKRQPGWVNFWRDFLFLMCLKSFFFTPIINTRGWSCKIFHTMHGNVRQICAISTLYAYVWCVWITGDWLHFYKRWAAIALSEYKRTHLIWAMSGRNYCVWLKRGRFLFTSGHDNPKIHSVNGAYNTHSPFTPQWKRKTSNPKKS